MSSKLYFITGNQGKWKEVCSILGDVERIEMDLPEIQAIDSCEVVRAKLQEACAHAPGRYMIDDTSLSFDCMNGLPGPLIKWFLDALGVDGLYTLAEHMGNRHASAKTIIGYANGSQDIHFFEGAVNGMIVPPRGTAGYGWDTIFEVDGTGKTFAEMTHDEKNAISMRRVALNKLRAYLDSNHISFVAP